MNGDRVDSPSVVDARGSWSTRVLALSGAALCFVLAAVWSLWSAWHLPSWDRQMDLHVYIGAVRAVGNGVPLYQYVAENGDPFTYPPFALVAFQPLGWVSEPVARVVWLAATLVAVVSIAAALTARRGIAGRRRQVALTLVAAAVLLVSAPIQSNLRFGQVSVFLVVLAFVDALDLMPRPVRGVLIGVASAIKLTPLLFVPYLWVTGRRRDAMRAGASFVACTGLAHALWPAASTTFWTDAIFSTSRIGNLAAAGNQSLNGALIRVGVVPPERAAAWLALSALVCAVALVGARQCHREGHPARGVVVVGCATVVASPVSWTHHQVWLVLAGLLLIAGPRKARVAWGVVLLVTMTVSVGGWLPGGFARENVRLLAALAVCTWGLAPLRDRAPATVGLLPGVRLVVRPRTAMAYAGVVAVAAGAVVLLVRESPITVRFETPDHRDEALWGPPTDGCSGYGSVPRADGTAAFVCQSMVDPVGGRQLNFGGGWGGPSGMVTIHGQVGPEVARLVFIPVEGTRALDVPLRPEGPDSGPVRPPEQVPPGTIVSGPIEDRRLPGARGFSIAATNTDHALLLAYGRDGKLIGDGGTKLRTG
ncbi:glycosyltransferase 87 family protein [Embleya sp. NPDC059259]|uniref:glycosyltransferase 87 family protein n=1 Tax=unclassified Embleya TaxID=2699296 RepID=UPI0036B0F55D